MRFLGSLTLAHEGERGGISRSSEPSCCGGREIEKTTLSIVKKLRLKKAMYAGTM